MEAVLVVLAMTVPVVMAGLLRMTQLARSSRTTNNGAGHRIPYWGAKRR